MVEITLSDAMNTATLQAPEVPLTNTPINNDVKVVTLDNNITTYVLDEKRSWSHTWAFMSKEDYDILKGFYDRMRTVHYQYPLLTITDLGVTDLPVDMTIGPENTIDDCLTVGGVQVVFRESAQMPTWGS